MGFAAQDCLNAGVPTTYAAVLALLAASTLCAGFAAIFRLIGAGLLG